MKRTEARGKTVEEARATAARELGVSEEHIRFEVIEEPRSGMFGLGGRGALVRGTVQEGKGDIAKAFVREFFEKAGMDTIVVARPDGDRISVTAEGDFDWFNGPKGETLESFQQLVNLVAQRAVERGEVEGSERVTVDLGGFRERRQLELEKMAHEIAAEVLASRQTKKLSPMSPNDRRILHITLEGYPGLTTRSEGEEPFRCVVVEPIGATQGVTPDALAPGRDVTPRSEADALTGQDAPDEADASPEGDD